MALHSEISPDRLGDHLGCKVSNRVCHARQMPYLRCYRSGSRWTFFGGEVTPDGAQLTPDLLTKARRAVSETESSTAETDTQKELWISYSRHQQSHWILNGIHFTFASWSLNILEANQDILGSHPDLFLLLSLKTTIITKKKKKKNDSSLEKECKDLVGPIGVQSNFDVSIK